MAARKTNMNDQLVNIEDVSIGYGGQAVLRGITLTIDRDSFTAILGANGSGKSTLLKTLLGLIPPVAGRIEFQQNPGAPLVFGYVPQANQFDTIYLLTAFDVALMGVYGRVGAGRRVPAREREFTWECLRAAGADRFARQRFFELSGGQKQRVLIARAIATRPDLLVLDEPTAGVDQATTREVMEFIAQLRRERGVAVLLVTHDFAVVRRHARQVIWLHQGKVLRGTAEELLKPDRLSEIFAMEMD
jgi:ABC-type Mn2+/Zn2+ transport system ATPase subunit